MKLLISTLFLLLTFALAQANSYERFYRDEKHPGTCVIDGHIVNPGQSIKHPTVECAEFTCDNAIGLSTIETCDPITALPSPLQSLKNYDSTNPPTCTWGELKNSKAAYPKCCERHFTCVY